MQESERLEYLLAKNRQQDCSLEELGELYQLLSNGPETEVHASLDAEYALIDPAVQTDDIDWATVLQKITAAPQRSPYHRLYYALAVAAVLAIGIFLLQLKPDRSYKGLALFTPHKTWKLDQLPDGPVGDLTLEKGKLIYPPGYNGPLQTVQVPIGKQFEVVMPDGSQVWLNAATSFSFQQRHTTLLNGEAYFDVTSGAATPFTVQLRDHALITVLGTRFNVHAYTHPITTVLAGAIQVNRGSRQVVLHPGQGITSGVGGLEQVIAVDTAQIAGWKQGFFESRQLDGILDEFHRWYGIQIRYEGDHYPDINFNGRLDRGLTLPEAMSTLREMGVRYRMDKDTVVIIRH